MKRMLWMIGIVFLASPLMAQDLGDVGGFLAGDAAAILNIPAPRGDAPAGNRGAAPARGAQPAGPPVDRLAGLRGLLVKANLPLTPEQDTALNALLDAEVPVMRRTLQARVLELQRARTAASPAPVAGAAPAPPSPPGGTPPTAGSRGAPPNLPSPDELLPDLNRLNDQLVAKIASAAVLTPDQQALIKKALKDQIRSRGGFDALNLTMEEAGAPFTPEQASQIQALFNEQAQLRAQTLREAQGQPADPAKLAQIERETLGKVLRLLNAAQRAVLTGQAAPRP